MQLFSEDRLFLYSELAVAIYQQAQEDLPISGILQTAGHINPPLLQALNEGNYEDFNTVIEAYYQAWMFWVSTALNTQDEVLIRLNQALITWFNEPGSPRQERKYLTQLHKEPAFLQVIATRLTQDLAAALSNETLRELNAAIKPYIVRTLEKADSFQDVYNRISHGPENSQRIFGGILENPTPAFQQACELYKEAVYKYSLNFLEQHKLSHDERFSRSFELILDYLTDNYPDEMLMASIDKQGSGNLRLISMIIEKLGAAGLVKPLDVSGYTPFHFICQVKGASEQVKRMFMLLGTSPKDLPRSANWKPVGLTQLLWSRIQQLQKTDASNVSEVINEIQKYLEAGAELANFDNASQKTALHYAAETGHVPVVSLLLEKCRETGIDPAQFTTAVGLPLHTAIIPKYEPVTEVQKLEVARLLLAQGFEVNAVDGHYLHNTALHYAVKHGYKQVVELLLDEYAADIDPQNNAGNTPLHLALESKKPEERDNLLKCITALLERGAELDIPNHLKETPRTLLSKNKNWGDIAKSFTNLTREQQLEKKLEQLPKLRATLAEKTSEIARLKWQLKQHKLDDAGANPLETAIQASLAGLPLIEQANRLVTEGINWDNLAAGMIQSQEEASPNTALSPTLADRSAAKGKAKESSQAVLASSPRFFPTQPSEPPATTAEPVATVAATSSRQPAPR